MKYAHVAAAILDTPWLITPRAMSAIIEILERRIEGKSLSDAQIADLLAIGRQEAGPRSSSRRAGAVAVIPVYGILAQRASYFEETSTGGTSVQSLQRAFREALADPDVASILFDVDSPGGHVSGIPEFGAEIRAARGQKPMVAIANTLMASAAYWLGAQADELVVTPSSLTGSIGVVMGHMDFSKQEEMLGIKTTLVHAGAYKVETYDSVALSDEARAHMQSIVDATYGDFLREIAAARGTTVAKVKSDFGEGRVFAPRQAVTAGMADRVDTFDGAVARLQAGKVVPRGGAGALARGMGWQQLGPAAAEPLEQTAMRLNQGGDAPPPEDAGDTPVDPDHDEGEDLEEATEPEAIARADIEIAKAKAAANSRR